MLYEFEKRIHFQTTKHDYAENRSGSQMTCDMASPLPFKICTLALTVPPHWIFGKMYHL